MHHEPIREETQVVRLTIDDVRRHRSLPAALAARAQQEVGVRRDCGQCGAAAWPVTGTEVTRYVRAPSVLLVLVNRTDETGRKRVDVPLAYGRSMPATVLGSKAEVGGAS